MRARHLVGVGAALLVAFSLSCGAVHAASAELAAARNDADAGTRSLEQRPCPIFGDRKYLRGLTEPQQLSGAAERERSYQEGALRQLQQIARDPQLGQEQRIELQSLASWSVSASMANWAMLQVASQALANPLIEPGRPYPSALLEAAGERIRQVAEGGAIAPEAAGLLKRQAAAVGRCAQAFGSQAYALNQPQFEAAVDAATSLVELNRVEQQYRARQAVAGGYGGSAADKLSARRSMLSEAERSAREQAQAANAADASRRQAEAQRRQAEMQAKLPAFLAVAQRFADAARGGNQQAALSELANDVVMITPTGTFRGIDAVVAEVRKQAASGGGNLGMPRIEEGRIVSYGNKGQFRLMTVFGFSADSRISRIDISI